MTSALRFVLTIGPRTDRVRSLIVVAVVILEQATGIGLAVLLGLFSEAANRHSTGDVLTLALCAAVFVMLTQGTFIAGYFTRLRLQEEIQNDVERQFLDVVGTTPTLEVHERSSRSDKAALYRDARGEIGPGFDRLLLLAGAALVLIASAALMASVVPVLAVLPLFAVPTVLATRAADDKRGQAMERATPRTRLAGHLFTLATTAAPGRETRLFGLAGELRRRHREAWDSAGRDIARADRRARIPIALAWLFFVLAYAIAIVLMVRAGLSGDASLGLVVTAIAVSSQITGQVQGVLSMTFWTLESLRATRAFLDVVEDAAVERAAVVPATPVAVPARLDHGIKVEGLDFQYWNRDQPSLNGIDIEFPAGAVVALVGENGAGKSTFVKMLSGLYQPSAGRVLVDGTDLAQFAPEDWRSRITVAFQDPVHIEMSLRDTIGLGRLQRRDDPERILEALRTAGGDKLLASLPEGLETRLGRKSWDGKGLSGGQWQTVANARAAMRQEPLLRILDEPTSSLDARAEEWLFQQYAGLSRLEGGVTVLVTHRFTTARAADLIVVLDGGRVVEVGTHDTLSQADGLYAELFRLQARYFV
ncbi:ABC-type multidrug transport system, ATPase and permease component [Streptomyces lincolnensis]|uniref:ABC-type multidrug transport system, ATPase and permease component n=1 Tax=Streptomyces lincolnensis TaxID=1915 RepID=A0A1B1MKF6_STRLN|nr:ABC transporter ATP-binding protein [Streptomyces lincolnensis]ANS68997.1 ABC-type multidrug transport system, ATPase and permease component [Streptomyces lincolnensis]AXG57916.1 ABC-type multidrug transport system, ATPase and permease component [Streptomyces lincolnensis]QMV10588.1 ATP-binding cassette domain-containing protein [Streptomyces lincolnensis]